MKQANIIKHYNTAMNRLYICIFFTASLFIGCDGKKTSPGSSAAPDSVHVFALKKDSVTKRLSLPLELHPWERTEVYAKVEGYVKALKVDIGDHVKRNDVLMVLDAPEATANYARAAADLQAARARYRTSLDRYKRIVNAAKEPGAVSESEMESARNQMLSDSASYAAGQSGADAYNQLRNYLTIRAVSDGIVTQRNVDRGTLVGKGRQPLLIVENLTKLRLRVAVPEAYTSAIPESSSIVFTVDAQPSRKYAATLARKSNQIDPETRTELWEFEAANPRLELKSGMYGNVNFSLHRAETSFVVPYSAVVTNNERNFVIRVRDNKTEWVDVKSGINLNDRVEVFGDLQEGDQLVMRANDELKAGKQVIAYSR
jgi:membrane fusion protein, multidrug efflux system